MILIILALFALAAIAEYRTNVAQPICYDPTTWKEPIRVPVEYAYLSREHLRLAECSGCVEAAARDYELLEAISAK